MAGIGALTSPYVVSAFEWNPASVLKDEDGSYPFARPLVPRSCVAEYLSAPQVEQLQFPYEFTTTGTNLERDLFLVQKYFPHIKHEYWGRPWCAQDAAYSRAHSQLQ